MLARHDEFWATAEFGVEWQTGHLMLVTFELFAEGGKQT